MKTHAENRSYTATGRLGDFLHRIRNASVVPSQTVTAEELTVVLHTRVRYNPGADARRAATTSEVCRNFSN